MFLVWSLMTRSVSSSGCSEIRSKSCRSMDGGSLQEEEMSSGNGFCPAKEDDENRAIE